MATQPDLDLQANIDTLTAIITRLEDQFYAAIAPHAEHLNGLRGRLAILHEMALDPLGEFERERIAFFQANSAPQPNMVFCWYGTAAQCKALARVLQQAAGGQQVAAPVPDTVPFPGYCGMYRGTHIFEGEALGFVWRPLDAFKAVDVRDLRALGVSK